MSKQRYILTVQNSDIFKEVDVSNERPVIKIGTLQDSDERLKREIFDEPIGLTLRLDGLEWRIFCDENLLIDTSVARSCHETVIRHGDVISVHSVATGKALLTVSFSRDFTTAAIDFDTIVDVRNIHQLTIGDSPSAQIMLKSDSVDAEYITLTRSQSGNGFDLDASNAQSSATINGIRVFTKAKVSEMDFFGIASFSFYYKNEILYIPMRDDLQINGLTTQPLRDETPAFDYPELNRSPRMIYEFNTEPIEVLSPPPRPTKPKDNIMLMIMPAFLMAIVIVITRSGILGNSPMSGSMFIIFSLSSMAVGVITSIAGLVSNRKQYRKDVEEWKIDYENYIAQKRKDIEAEQRAEVLALHDMYPSSEQMSEFVKTFSGRLYERLPKDSDFLHVRAGLGSIPAIRELTYKDDEKVKVENELATIPEELCNEYRFIENAPVMLHLREAGSIGVIGTPEGQYEFFKTILLDICISHHYEEVNVVVLLPQEERERYKWIKLLPHLKESGGGMRGIVYDSETKENVFESLYALMTMRSAERKGDNSNNLPPIPYYVVFMLDEYGVKSHPLYQFSENCASLGFSFVHFKSHKENLPQHCEEIVELKDGIVKTGGSDERVLRNGVLRLRSNKAFMRPFVWEQTKDISISFVTDRLAPVYCEKISLSSRLTTSITLFELLNIITPEDLNLLDRWGKSQVQKTLAAPLGVNVKGEQQMLDLHEKAHGPHGLVAGTTGSGKSEIMQSYIHGNQFSD